jgi:ABC-type Fe3+-hydroxamate transport system substrate-binding protein
VRFFSVICISFFVWQSVFACDVIDDTGPDLTEILFSVNAGKNIVGVSQGSDYPESAKRIKVIATYNSLDNEALLALHPDLIVSWTDVNYAARLKKLHVPVYFSHQSKISDIPVTMSRLACLSGNQKYAEKVTQSFLQRLQILKNYFAAKKRVTIFYQIWSKPLITITKNSWINEVLVLCGGKNVFEDLNGVAPQVSLESVILADPDMIIGSDTKNWQKWSQTTSVRHPHLFSLNTDLIERAGPRILEGAESMCHILDKVRNETI